MSFPKSLYLASMIAIFVVVLVIATLNTIRKSHQTQATVHADSRETVVVSKMIDGHKYLIFNPNEEGQAVIHAGDCKGSHD